MYAYVHMIVYCKFGSESNSWARTRRELVLKSNRNTSNNSTTNDTIMYDMYLGHQMNGGCWASASRYQIWITDAATHSALNANEKNPSLAT